jgi:hypothetical protein
MPPDILAGMRTLRVCWAGERKEAAEKAKIDASWVRALKTRLRRNLLRARLSDWDRRYLGGISRRLYGALCGQGKRRLTEPVEIRPQ